MGLAVPLLVLMDFNYLKIYKTMCLLKPFPNIPLQKLLFLKLPKTFPIFL